MADSILKLLTDNVPRSLTTWICILVAIVFIAVVIRTERREHHRGKRRNHLTAQQEIRRVLGNTKACAPEYSVVQWSISKDNRFLVDNKEVLPAIENVLAFLNREVTRIAGEISMQNPKREELVGIEVDPSWIAGLWKEKVISLDDLLRSHSSPTAVEIRLTLGGKPLVVFMTYKCTAAQPIEFRKRQLLVPNAGTLIPDPKCSCYKVVHA